MIAKLTTKWKSEYHKIMWKGESFQDYSWSQDLEADFP